MDLMDYRRKIIMSSPHLSHAEGAVATFSDGTDLPLNSLLVDIDPVQSGSGDPSPSNERPISGWSAANVTGTGKSLLGGLTLGNAIVNAVSNSTYSHLGSDGNGDYVTIKAGSAVEKVFTTGIKFKANTQYTVILCLTRYQTGTNLNSNIRIRYTDGTTAAIAFTTTSDTEVVTIARTTTAGKTVKDIEGAWGGGEAKVFYEESGIFEGVLTADQFEPYTGTSLTISLGRTVYGGTLNVLTGELVVDRAYKLFDASEPTTNIYSVTVGADRTRIIYTGLADAKRGTYLPFTSNAFVHAVNSNPPVGYGSINNGYIVVGVPKTVTTKDEAVTYLASINAEFVYELATPQTYTLDPQTVRTLIGQNNIFSDTGNVALDYWAHP